MVELLEAAFRSADRLPPSEQNELAERILAEVAPDVLGQPERYPELSVAYRTVHARRQ